jgi:hypothetical protein
MMPPRIETFAKSTTRPLEQSQRPQAQERPLARAPPSRPLPLHSNPHLVVQPDLVLEPGRVKSLPAASFNPVKQLREHIYAFIDNHHAKPFVWTKTEVFQRRADDHRVSQIMIPGTDDVSCGF